MAASCRLRLRRSGGLSKRFDFLLWRKPTAWILVEQRWRSVRKIITFAPENGPAVQAGTPMTVNEDGSRVGSGAGVSHLCSSKYPSQRGLPKANSGHSHLNGCSADFKAIGVATFRKLSGQHRSGDHDLSAFHSDRARTEVIQHPCQGA